MLGARLVECGCLFGTGHLERSGVLRACLVQHGGLLGGGLLECGDACRAVGGGLLGGSTCLGEAVDPGLQLGLASLCLAGLLGVGALGLLERRCVFCACLVERDRVLRTGLLDRGGLVRTGLVERGGVLAGGLLESGDACRAVGGGLLGGRAGLGEAVDLGLKLGLASLCRAGLLGVGALGLLERGGLLGGTPLGGRLGLFEVVDPRLQLMLSSIGGRCSLQRHRPGRTQSLVRFDEAVCLLRRHRLQFRGTKLQRVQPVGFAIEAQQVHGP